MLRVDGPFRIDGDEAKFTTQVFVFLKDLGSET